MGPAMLINCLHHQERNIREDAMNLISTVFFSQKSLYEKNPNSSPFTHGTVAKSYIAKYPFVNQQQTVSVQIAHVN